MRNYLNNISSRLPFGQGLGRIVSNSGWLVLDRLFRLGGGLLLSLILARYLGPERFGILSYALSATAFLGAFVYLGLSGLVVREIVHKPGESHLILGATFALKTAGAVLAYGLLFTLALLTAGSKIELLTLLITGLTLFFKPFDTIDFWFQSRVQSRFTVLARISGFIISALVKAGLVLAGTGLVSLAMASSLEFFLAACFLVLVYRMQGNSILQWKLSLKRTGQLLSQSWILLLSGFLGLVYLKVDQVMLRWLKGAEEVGIYSVASMLSEAWYFIPAVIALSFYPRLIELKKEQSRAYDRAVQGLLDLLLVLAAAVAFLVSIAASWAVNLLYGPEYQSAAGVLMIHVWAGLFMFMREVFNKWVLIENLLKFTVLSHGLGALSNVLLNLTLIPGLGVYGAALATLASYAFAGYFFLFLHPATAGLGWMMTRSFLLPLRILKKARDRAFR